KTTLLIVLVALLSCVCISNARELTKPRRFDINHHVNQSWPNHINILGVALKIVTAKIVVLIRANFKNVLITNVTAEN
ncbi:unnamed protein product, partial [Brassica oleracea var. botrytis]